MKLCHSLNVIAIALSHPSRGAWIEMGAGYTCRQDARRRTPRGVRGLKYQETLA